MSKVVALPDQSDDELLALLRNDNEIAFQRIYMRYSKKLYAIAYNRLRSREITEEIVQEVFVSLWEKRKKLVITNLPAYLYSAVKYDVLDHLKSQKIRERFADNVKRLGEPVENTTEKQLTFDELYTIMQHEVNKLPEKCRLIFKLSREEFHTAKEIASQLKISAKTVDNQINKATGVLRLQLADYLHYMLLCIIFF